MSKIKWPKSVWVNLSADDVCQLKFDDGDRHCLLGWAFECFGRRTNACDRALDAIMGVIDDWCIPEWNDSHTKTQCAKAWNHAMKDLGYTEISDG